MSKHFTDKHRIEFEVDDEDDLIVMTSSWRINQGYVRCNDGYLHWVLMGDPPEERTIDHKDRNRLNNRRSNLRFVTYAESVWNRKISSNNLSGFTGVYFDEARGLWVAGIMTNGARKFLGRFADLEEAVFIRQQAEIQQRNTL